MLQVKISPWMDPQQKVQDLHGIFNGCHLLWWAEKWVPDYQDAGFCLYSLMIWMCKGSLSSLL